MKEKSALTGADRERPHVQLTRRERQIMDVLYSQNEASAADVQAAIPDAPGYSAVRAMLQKLLDKGHVEYRVDGPRYLYRPRLLKDQAKKNAWLRLIDTFFGGSRIEAMVNLLGDAGSELAPDDLARLESELKKLKARESGKSQKKSDSSRGR